MKLLYSFTIVLSAFLLFSVEPMITRALLPQLGGSSAIWITALAFFQIVLLLGYAYSVPMAKASPSRPVLVPVHLGLLTLAFLSLLLPVAHPPQLGATEDPQRQLFFLLGTTIGLPFLALSTTAPLLQAWYARREGVAVPYRLFGLSNFAALLGLLAYPTVIERFLSLRVEFLLWKAGFLAYALLAGMLTLRMRKAPPDGGDTRVSAPVTLAPRRQRFLWFGLPAVASLQLAAVTEHLTQNVASMPLLWVLPLAAYLLSFVLAFDLPRLYSRALVLRMLAVLLFALGYFLAGTGFNVPIGLSIGFYSAELFLAAWFCHAELFKLRPDTAAQSTRFYLHIAAGGAAGTLCVAVLSPLLTDSNFDLPASFLVTAAVVLLVVWELGWALGWAQRLLWSSAVVLSAWLLVILHADVGHDALFRARNFYGSLRVKQTQTPPQAFLSRTLYNGSIQHGMQWFSTDFRRAPLTYYAPDSGVGLALDHCCGPMDSSRPRRIGVIGLGAGTLAAYGRRGDAIRFYEINPLVIDVAQHLFTYTRDTPATVTIVPGDARLSLAAERADGPQPFDLLVVDAFSGDSIPIHLLTREALALYRRHLAPGGVLAFHISNQYLDLAPVLARLAESTRTGTGAPLIAREVDSEGNEARGESLASWVLLSEDADFFAQPALAARARPIATQPDVGLWTDQSSSLLPILSWSGRRASNTPHR